MAGADPAIRSRPCTFSTPRNVARLALAMLLALLALLSVYLMISIRGAWFPAATPKAFAATGLVLARGTGQIVGDELHVTAADATGLTVVSQVTKLKSSDYAAISWTAIDLPAQAKVRMLWRTDFAPEKLNAIEVPLESGRTLPVIVANNPMWIGDITGLALAIQGPLSQPIRVRGVVASPLGALEILGGLTREWFAFEGWSGTSINTVTGGADIQDFPLPVLLALTVALAGAGAVLLGLWRPGTFGASTSLALGILFLIAWLALDARWAANLARQVGHTAKMYAGKSMRDKLLANDDAQLLLFIERALQVLPPQPTRIFVASDVDYFRGRAAYHLYPHSVFFNARSNELPWADQMRPDDWLLVYQQPEIRYDASQQVLMWKTGKTTGAELKLAEPGAALFRIK